MVLNILTSERIIDQNYKASEGVSGTKQSTVEQTSEQMSDPF